MLPAQCHSYKGHHWYPGSDRRILERLYNAASDRAAVAEKVRDEAHDLDKEEALSRTDTLPLS